MYNFINKYNQTYIIIFVFVCYFRISVGVFFCGPSALSNTLHQQSNKHSAVDGTGAKFFYNKENF